MTGSANLPDARFRANLARVETCLNALESYIVSGEPDPIETEARNLQQALADTMACVKGGVTAVLAPDLRERLKSAQARTLALQGSVHRALASAGRSLTALFPQEGNDTYGVLGQSPSTRALSKAYR